MLLEEDDSSVFDFDMMSFVDTRHVDSRAVERVTQGYII